MSWFQFFKKKHNLSKKYYSVSDLAIAGYDPVAYFIEKRAKRGKKEHIFIWNSLEWRFYNAANREHFIKNPLDYAPQFGGFCSWGMKEGYRAKTEPQNAWTIIDGKLYFNYNVKYKKLWQINAIEYIQIAVKNWKILIKKPEY